MLWFYLVSCLAPDIREGARRHDADRPGAPGSGSVVSPAPDPLAPLFGDVPVELALTLDEAAIAGLARSASETPPDVTGTFTWGEEVHTVGLRLKGGQGSFRTFEQKPSFTLDFGDDPLFGLQRMHLNNLVQDLSMLGEHAAYRLFEARDLAAPRHGLARLTVNGEPFGLYGVVDKVDVDLLHHAFGTRHGLLFEGEMDDLEDYLVDDYVVVQDGGHADPFGRLAELVTELDATPWDARGELLSARFDRDRLLDAFATELVSGNDDGYVTWNNNYFLWEDPDSGRFTMIPWGPDQAFQARVSVTNDWSARLWTDCRNDPTCAADLDERIVAAAAVFEDPAWRARIEAVAAETEADCLTDPRAETVGDACLEARAELFAFFDERPAEVRAELGLVE